MFPRQSLFIFALVLSLFIAAKVAAQTTNFTITTTVDVVDASPGDGLCDIGTGECSLRAAIMEVNALDVAATINIPAGNFLLTLTGANEDASTTGDLDVIADISLIGTDAASTVIDANYIDRVLHILADATVTVENVTIQNGHLFSETNHGAGIHNTGTLTIRNVRMTNNKTEKLETYFSGMGGAVYNVGQLSVEGSYFTANEGRNGGAIHSNSNATISIADSTFDNNDATHEGGAVYVREADAGVIERSTFVNNEGNYGGAIETILSTLTLRNNTISSNRARSDGGATYFHTSQVTLQHNTIVYNQEYLGGYQSTTNYFGNLIVLNTDSNPNYCTTNPLAKIVDNYNFVMIGSCQDANAVPATAAALGIAPLADNGGLTQTHAILSTSRAVNAIPLSTCVLMEDQRGVQRLAGNRCDIGAYELDIPFSPYLMNITTNAATADGILVENEFTPYAITQILVTLDGTVDNPAGDSDPYDVTNPANYRLLRPGADAAYSTVGCGTLAGDDIAVAIDSISYDEATFTITANVNGGTALPNSRYRFIICPNVSRGGLLFDANQDNIGGDPFIRNFEVDTNRQLGPTFTVNINEDTNDGYCSLTHCSLRDAVLAANAEAGHNTIMLPAGTYTLTIGDIINPGHSTNTNDDNVGMIGDVDITDDLSIIGAGADITAIDGVNQEFILLSATGNFNLHIEGITIKNGFASIASRGPAVTLDGVYSFNSLEVGLGLTAPEYTNPRPAVTIRNSTIAYSGRQGITLYYVNANIYNTTITNNGSYEGGDAGGIWTFPGASLYNVTVVNNRAFDGAGLKGNFYAVNSIIYGNVPKPGSGGQADCDGSLISGGYNYIGTTLGCHYSDSHYQPTDIIGGPNPLLSSLQLNGGTTPSLLPMIGSPLIGAGNPGVPGTTTGTCEPFDQRGVDRSLYGCDIGAVQTTYPPFVQSVAGNYTPFAGVISNNEQVDAPISQLRLKFSNTMSQSDAASVTLAQNYLLVNSGSDNVLQTSSCDMVDGDDISITIDSVTYDAASRTATLNLNGGNTLLPQKYKLFACDTLQNLVGSTLDGDNDGLSSPDFALNFDVLPLQTGSTLVVNLRTDEFDGYCGTIHCSLRDAIHTANITSEEQVIEVPYNTYTRSTDTPFSILDNVQIIGTGTEYSTLDGTNNSSGFFVVAAGYSLTLNHLVLLNANDPAIVNNGTLLLENSEIVSGQNFRSSALYNTGTATIRGSNITGNVITEYNLAGAIENVDGTLIVEDSQISGNVGGFGGAIYSTGTSAHVEIDRSSVSGNRVPPANYSQPGQGGAIYLTNGSTLTVTNTTMAYNNSKYNGSVLFLENSGAVRLHHVTISLNTNSSSGVPIYIFGSSSVEVGNSIISNNTGSSLGGTIASLCDGTMVSTGGNVFGNLGNCIINGSTELDLFNINNPMLNEPDFYGETTPIMSIKPGSPVIARGNPATCAAVDQHNHLRNDGRCDSGAYEETAPLQIAGVYHGTTAITNGGMYPIDVYTLRLDLNKPAYNPAGNSDPHDVTNPAHYLLVADGGNNTFETTNCTTQGDDTALPLGNISYSNFPPIIGLETNQGNPLPIEHYRLLVCDSLYSLSETALDGDNDNIAGGHFLLDFHVIDSQPGPDYTVTTTLDTNDGFCTVTHCSLREAIIAANANSAGNSVINLAAGTYNLTITGTNEDAAATGDLDVYTNVTLQGVGTATTIIDGQGIDRVFEFINTSGAIRDLTIRGGNAGSGDGGGIYLNSNTTNPDYILNLWHVNVEANQANNGGGLAARMSFIETDYVRLIDNNAANAGGGYYIDTLPSISEFTIDDTEFRDNNAQLGGGLYFGGSGSSTTLSVQQSLFTTNTAVDGGAVYATGTTTLIVSISTISQNQASNRGGAVYQANTLAGFYEMTITANIADSDANGSGSGNALYRARRAGSSSVSANNIFMSIIYGNTNGHGNLAQCALAETPASPWFRSLGDNLFSSNFGCNFASPVPTGAAADMFGVNPQLNALTDNGGFTQTHALQPNSPAINASSSIECSGVDQRGVLRQFWGNCDSGAFEYITIPYTAIPPFVLQTHGIRLNGSDEYLIEDNEETTEAWYGLRIHFNEFMLDIAGSTTHPGEVDNPANYRLMKPGNDGIFQTTSCAVQGDDVAEPIAITNVVMASGKNYTGDNEFVTSVDIYSQLNVPLPSGTYRLIACATLTDSDNNALDGNANGVGGDSYVITFTSTYPYTQPFDVYVNSTNNVNDGVCDAVHCSLVEGRNLAYAMGEYGKPTLHIAAGNYTLTNRLDFTSRNVTIIGAGIDQTIINGSPSDYILYSDNVGEITVRNLTLSNAGKSAIFIRGSGLFEFTHLLLEDVNITDNTSVNGGGLYATDTMVTIHRVFFDNNTATQSGGAIYIANSILNLSHSAIVRNASAGDGSALYIGNTSAIDVEQYHIANTTIADNLSPNSVIYFDNGIDFDFVTIANNNSGLSSGTNIHNSKDAVSFFASILANSGQNCKSTPATIGDYNIIDDYTCFMSGVGNQAGINPQLQPLEGSNYAHVLSLDSNSPAVDVVSSIFCTQYTDDQLGVARPFGNGCDAGAYESQQIPGAPYNPANLRLTNRTDSSLALAWDDTNTTETTYHLERSTDGVTWAEIAVLPADTSSYTDNSTLCNTLYRYRVRAYRSSDNRYSGYSNRVTSSLLCNLNVPGGFAATTIGQTQLTLGWQDTNVNETAYEIQRSVDNGLNWLPLVTTGANAISAVDASVSCGTAYQYRARAYRSVDSTYSAFTAVITVTSDWCTLTVNSTADTTTCSVQVCTLRGAMYVASRTSNPNTVRINFNIPGTGPHIITVNSSLPSLQHSVIIDGWSQPGFNGKPLIVVDGRSITETFSWGLQVHAPNTVIRGMNVNGFHWGIWVGGYDNYVVEGNWIGIDPTGMFSDVPNSFPDYENSYGLRVDSVTNTRIGGTSPQSANRFGSNRNIDIFVTESSNITIQGNIHGVAVDGVTPIVGRGNAIVVLTAGSDMLVGGLNAGEGNIIANRPGGILLHWNVIRVGIVGNSMYNLSEDLAIDLTDNTSGTLAVTPNDVGDTDSGGNNLQNFPILTDVHLDGSGQLVVNGTLNSEANTTYRVDVYASDQCHSSGYGPGQRYIAGSNVNTDGTGNASFNLIYAAGVTGFTYVTATATTTDGNTSEFSACYFAYQTGYVVPPTNLVSSLMPPTIELTWQDHEPLETAYYVERSLDGGASWTEIANLPANSAAYSDADIEIDCERRFDYRVRAYRNLDDTYSDWATVTLTTETCPVPRPPTSVTATGTSRNTITVNWQDNNLSTVTYEIERTAIGTGNWFTIAQFPAGVETFANNNLLCNRGYDYRMRTFRPADSLYSPYSPVVNATTLVCPPLDPPVIPPIEPPGRSEVTINLPASSDITTYFIERSVGSSSISAMSVSTLNWEQIAAVPGYMLEFTDTGLNCDTTYIYRLRGYRVEDNSYSPYSDETTIITAPCPIPVTNTVGLYRNGLWQFRDVNATGSATIQFTFGPREAGWMALTGDWDGDGVDGIGLYRNGLFILRNASEQGAVEYRLRFGPQESGWQPIVGDWNGDGVDTIGVYRNGLFMLGDSNATAMVDYRFRLGVQEAGWQAIAGDWDASGWDSVGLYRNGYFYLSNSLDGSGLLRPFQFGPAQAGWIAITGDWDADGVISIGLYNSSIWRLRNNNSTGSSDVGFNFGANEAGWQPIASYRGGATALAVMAQSAVDTPLVIPTETVITPTAQTTEPTITPLATETPVVTQEMTIELSQTPFPTETAVTPEPTIAPTETVVQPETVPTEPEAPISEVFIEQTPEVTLESASN